MILSKLAKRSTKMQEMQNCAWQYKIWKLSGVGRHLCGHLCSILQEPGCPWSRSCCSQSWVTKGWEVLWPPPHTWIHARCCGVFWSFWAIVIAFCEGVGEEVKAPDKSREDGGLPHAAIVRCHVAGHCSFNFGGCKQSALPLNMILWFPYVLYSCPRISLLVCTLLHM